MIYLLKEKYLIINKIWFILELAETLSCLILCHEMKIGTPEKNICHLVRSKNLCVRNQPKSTIISLPNPNVLFFALFLFHFNSFWYSIYKSEKMFSSEKQEKWIEWIPLERKWLNHDSTNYQNSANGSQIHFTTFSIIIVTVKKKKSLKLVARCDQ